MIPLLSYVIVEGAKFAYNRVSYKSIVYEEAIVYYPDDERQWIN